METDLSNRFLAFQMHPFNIDYEKYVGSPSSRKPDNSGNCPGPRHVYCFTNLGVFIPISYRKPFITNIFLHTNIDNVWLLVLSKFCQGLVKPNDGAALRMRFYNVSVQQNTLSSFEGEYRKALLVINFFFCDVGKFLFFLVFVRYNFKVYTVFCLVHFI